LKESIQGEKFIPLDDLDFPSRCLYCGSNTFVVHGIKRAFFMATFKVTKESIEDCGEEGQYDSAVAYEIACAECGKILNNLVGLD